MPPRKRPNSASSSAASKKSAKDQNQTPQPPPKYGIQHFFVRHSQRSASLAESGNALSNHEALRPDVAGCDVGSEQNNPIFVAGDDESVAVVADPPAVTSSPSRSNCVKDTFLAGDVIGKGSDGGESPIEVTPEISKTQPFKRFKFSPGMLIKQSQDDVVNEVTWKISPVNERLKAISKKMPEMIKVLAESSKLNSSYIQQCSLRKGAPDPIGNLETWLSSPTRSTVEQPLLCSNKMGVKRVNSCGDPGSKGRATELKHNCLASQQSPFRTPPSCQDKPVDRFEFNEASDERGSRQHGSRQHKKAFLELLDQVEDAISVDVSGINMMGAPLTKDKDQECSNLSRETDQKEQAAADILKSVDGLPVDQIFLVLEVAECSSADSQTANYPYKVLQLLNEKTGEQRIVCLFDEWIYCTVSPGDTVNVIGQFNDTGKCNVNRDNNFLVLHPYLLVSGTRVASSFGCPRRSVLDERLKSNDYSTAALVGTMLHQIFQAGLVKENLTRDFMEEYANIVLQRNFENLFACGANEKDIRDTLTEAIPKLILWINQFRDSQRSNAPGVHFGSDDATKKIKISEVIDIEEMSWAPNYGLKGMIDASIRVTVENETNKVMEKIMPLEFKSGKGPNGQSSMEHTAQVILYTLLMSERYLKPIDSGLLYYLQSNHTQGIAVQRFDLVGLIIRRNEIANDILKALTSQQLPPMLQSLTMCRGCRHLNVCTIYHKAHGGSAETSGLSNLFDACTDHLMASHFDFLKRWDRLIDLEAKDAEQGKKEIWQSRSMRHNRLASSLSSIVLDTTTELPNSKHYKDGRFHYRFVCQEFPLDKVNACLEDKNNTSAVSSSSNDSACALRRGDLVILTTESDRQAIANGVISEISGSHISVSFSKRLRLPRRCLSKASDLTKEVWRIDKDEIMTSFAVMRFNLIQLFLDNAWSSRLRKMIVDLEAPRFDSGCIFSQDPAISYVWSEKNLNDDQRRAILKILTAKDYALILGMPGTGKTSTMVYAVKALLMRGATILLTSYTNSAIDNLLIKLKDQGIDFLRIGRDEAVHEEVREHCISATDVRSIDNIKERLEEVKVVAVTCLGIMNPLLTNKRFDICIMDEAGQTTLPVALGPLMLATTFVLVGDHYQLPPLVKSMEAQENGLGISLFCRLSEVHPQAISALQSQYRMCQGIMQLANALIYGDRLRCGSSDVANAKLKFPMLKLSKSWLKEVLAPDRSVLFLNTDMLPALEEKDNKTLNNPMEASIIAEVSEELVNHGITEDQIGIITPYNSQANLIQAAVTSAVEIHTIDKYQGRDKDCILVSFVRSSEKIKHRNNSILEDWHRINVAITRAKKKLIMVGSCRMLSKWPLLKLLIEKVDEQSGLLTLSMKDVGVVTTTANASK